MKNKWVREDLKNFTPYRVTQEPNAVRLDANESFFFLPSCIKDRLILWLQDEENLNRYPDTDNTQLRQAIANFHNLSIENVTCGVGSDQLIDSIIKVFISPKETVLSVSPTFSMYEMSTRLNHGCFSALALDEDFHFSGSELVDESKRIGAKLILLCTPNNPTGNALDMREILYVLENCDIPVVIDEAYIEFTETSLVSYIPKYENLIILRTFSKAYGLAGARVGYALAQRDLIDSIDIVKPPFNLPTLSQFLATEAIQEHDLYRERTAQSNKNLKYMQNALERFDFIQTHSSCANFLYIHSDRDLYHLLKEKGILVRNLGFRDNRYTIRISVGTEKEISQLLCALENTTQQ